MKSVSKKKKRVAKKIKKTKKTRGAWIGEVIGSVGRYIHIETTDGVFREGKLTGLRTRDVMFNGQEAQLPVAVELNGDPNDFIDLSVVHSMEID